jgi:probable phosphomutase (TIGR03848 family)
MTTLAFIRHAAYDGLGYTIVGRSPGVGLSPEGVEVAEELAERLVGSSVRAIYSSPLERARRTAAAIGARLGLEARIADELNEIDFGDWTERAVIELNDSEQWRRFNRFRSGSRAPNGEAMIEVQARMLRLLERLCKVHPIEIIALVSHGDVIKATLAYFLGVPLDLFQRIEISPASLSIVRVERYGPRVLLVNGPAEKELFQA